MILFWDSASHGRNQQKEINSKHKGQSFFLFSTIPCKLANLGSSFPPIGGASHFLSFFNGRMSHVENNILMAKYCHVTRLPKKFVNINFTSTLVFFSFIFPSLAATDSYATQLQSFPFFSRILQNSTFILHLHSQSADHEFQLLPVCTNRVTFTFHFGLFFGFFFFLFLIMAFIYLYGPCFKIFIFQMGLIQFLN